MNFWEWLQILDADDTLPDHTKHTILRAGLFLNKPKGERFFSYEQLAGATNKSKSTVRAHIAVALKDGWLERVEGWSGRRASRYELSIPTRQGTAVACGTGSVACGVACGHTNVACETEPVACGPDRTALYPPLTPLSGEEESREIDHQTAPAAGRAEKKTIDLVVDAVGCSRDVATEWVLDIIGKHNPKNPYSYIKAILGRGQRPPGEESTGTLGILRLNREQFDDLVKEISREVYEDEFPLHLVEQVVHGWASEHGLCGHSRGNIEWAFHVSEIFSD